ncbi:FliO/MopB family protein [Piscinibacter terrae]|uniref:Flagellar biosynthetic protein FliO n=1 Tax=Piscinibacter terrae TaxID=2496871 RepID=A0A3N7HJW9_9BURK|nr:flagellar biosynthetic protein FliO [Albitalea terrae]RQP21256.1 flagellar biosynthetic protein FliO [Albitalea terrae]
MNDGPGLVANLISTVVALIAVLALAWVSLKLLKRMQLRRTPGGDEGHLPRIVGSVGLGPRERLVTVRYRGRDYLLGVTAGGISTVDSHEIDPHGNEVE